MPQNNRFNFVLAPEQALSVLIIEPWLVYEIAADISQTGAWSIGSWSSNRRVMVSLLMPQSESRTTKRTSGSCERIRSR